MRGLSSTTKERIELEIERLFEQMSYDFLGWTPNLGGSKRITFSTVSPQYTLANLFVQSLDNRHPTESEADALKGMLKIAENYLNSLKETTKSKILSQVDSYVISKRNKQELLSSDKISDIIEAEMGQAKKKLEVIAMAESSKTKTFGTALDIVKVAASNNDNDPTVFFQIMKDANVCKFCLQNHTIDGFTPRLFKLSEVESGYLTKDDLKAGKVSLSLAHVNCRCQISYIPNSFGFSPTGALTYIAPGHDEYKKQRS